jgi:hypothetical protein
MKKHQFQLLRIFLRNNPQEPLEATAATVSAVYTECTARVASLRRAFLRKSFAATAAATA